MAATDVANDIANKLRPWPVQDWIVLAGEKSPGVAVVRGAETKRTWDIQNGYGTDGATLVFHGGELTKFDVDIFAWLPEHFSAWKRFARATLLPPTDRARVTSMSIEHPLLNDPPVSIQQVVVEGISQWEQDPEDMLWVRTIKFIQYRAPVPVLARPDVGPPGSPINVKPPVDIQVEEMRTNTAEIKFLSNQ